MENNVQDESSKLCREKISLAKEERERQIGQDRKGDREEE